MIKRPYPKQEVAKILAVSPENSFVHIEEGSKKLTIESVETLIAIGATELTERQNDAPSIGEFLEFFKDISAEVEFIGYAVLPPRPDVRVSIEGFIIKPGNPEESCAIINAFHAADEFTVDRDGTIRAWWD